MRAQKFHESDSPSHGKRNFQKTFHDDYPQEKENYPNDDHSRFAGPDYKEISHFEIGHEDPVVKRPAVPYQFTVDKMHFGKGPKGYSRTADRLYEDICDALMKDLLLDATDIDVRVEESCVIVEGEVDDENMFDRAMSIIHHVQGSGEVVNRLRIKGDDHQAGLGPEAVTQKDLGVGHYS